MGHDWIRSQLGSSLKDYEADESYEPDDERQGIDQAHRHDHTD